MYNQKMAATRRITAMQALKKLIELESDVEDEDDDSNYTPSECSGDFGDPFAGIY
jgi:hypothetical protein